MLRVKYGHICVFCISKPEHCEYIGACLHWRVCELSPLWSWSCFRRSTSIRSCQVESYTLLPPDMAPFHTTTSQLQWMLQKVKHRVNTKKVSSTHRHRVTCLAMHRFYDHIIKCQQSSSTFQGFLETCLASEQLHLCCIHTFTVNINVLIQLKLIIILFW